MSNKVLPIVGNKEVDAKLKLVDYVAGRLSDEDKQYFEAELKADEQLQARVEAERALRDHIVNAVPHSTPDSAAFARLKQQIQDAPTLLDDEQEEQKDEQKDKQKDKQKDEQGIAQEKAQAARLAPRRWFPVAIAASLIAAAFLLTTTLQVTQQGGSPVDAEFTTLSSDGAAPATTVPRYRVLFSSELPGSEHAAVANALGIEIVRGAGPAGTVVAVAPQPLSREQLDMLRADPRVLFVEPIRYESRK